MDVGKQVPVSSRAGGRGRPRDVPTHQAILAAAYSELQEVGFRKVTIEAVAKRAASSKSTIYRWWPDKAALLMEAIASRQQRYPEFDRSRSTREQLQQEISEVVHYFQTEPGAAFLDLVAESRFDSALAHALSKEFIANRRTETRSVLTAAASRGEVRADLDIETLMDMVWGAIYYRFLVYHDHPSVTFAKSLFDQFWRLIQPTKES